MLLTIIAVLVTAIGTYLITRAYAQRKTDALTALALAAVVESQILGRLEVVECLPDSPEREEFIRDHKAQLTIVQQQMQKTLKEYHGAR